MAVSKRERDKIKAEALEILTAPGGPCDPFAGSATNPDMLVQIIKESLDIFVSQNPQPSGRSPEELADAFLHQMAGQKRRQPRRDHSRHHNTKPAGPSAGFSLAWMRTRDHIFVWVRPG